MAVSGSRRHEKDRALRQLWFRAALRERFAEGLLLTLAPRDRAEAVGIADALQDGLIDIGSVDDGERRAEILDRLLRSLP